MPRFPKQISIHRSVKFVIQSNYVLQVAQPDLKHISGKWRKGALVIGWFDKNIDTKDDAQAAQVQMFRLISHAP